MKNRMSSDWGGPGYPTYDGEARAAEPPAPPAAPPTAPPPPTDPNEMTREQVRQAVEGGQPAATPPAPAAPAPQAPPAGGQQQWPTRNAETGQFELTLPTGQRYVGASDQEVMQKVIEAQVNASRRITSLTDEAERMRNAARAAIGGQPQQGDEGPQRLQWNPEMYSHLHEKDPMLAFDYMMGCRMGLTSVEDVAPALERIQNNALEYESNLVVSKFRAYAPDFPGTAEAVNTLIDTMQRSNIPFSAENLNLLHRSLVAQHAIDPKVGYAAAVVPPQPGQQPQQNAPPAPGAQPWNPNYSPEPTGMYAFAPGTGFGVPQAMAPPANVPQIIGYMGNGQPVYSAPPSAAAPPPQFVPPGVPSNAFPAQPNVPLPSMPSQAAPVVQGQLDEAAIMGMDTAKLREAIQGALQQR